MTHISGFERSQILLLPEAVDDYVGADNPVRFIDAFVDELDLSAAGFVRIAVKATGRPGYAPADLLKLYIYGYVKRVRSRRRLEMESHRNIEVIWLLRSVKPDFKTVRPEKRFAEPWRQVAGFEEDRLQQSGRMPACPLRSRCSTTDRGLCD
jgi:transposase